MPVSLLSRLARLFQTSNDTLSGEGGMPKPGTPVPRRSKRGPPSKLERQLDAVLAQHQGQEAATAS